MRLKSVVGVCGALVVGMLAFASPVMAQPANIVGAWEVSVDSPQGALKLDTTFKQDGEKLTGQYEGQLGTSDLEGTVKGAAIEFSFTINVQGQQAPVTYDGTIEKNTMKGKMDIGGMVNGTFTGTKK